ncbi:hypothetical protein BC829DRAFT_70379 [Chytridium lagenaria]|nr:hypothetical protein BC829DRAFT_70379 [Chytridium lagenaria]
MGKKALNPADAHRRQLRKRELKKNKETRKKSQGLAVSKKEAQDIINELAKLDNLEKAAPLDRSMSLRREALEEKLAKVNEARKQQGMTALSVPSSSRPPTSTGDPSQWNNSAFNPYGMPGVPVQGEDDEEDDDDDDDSSDQSEDIEGAPEEVIDVKEAPIPAKLDDFSWIKVPDGEPPNEARSTLIWN